MLDRSDIYPYRRAEKNKGAKKKGPGRGAGLLQYFTRPEIAGLLNPGFIAACFAAFFLGRAVLLGELAPFAPAFAAAGAVFYGGRGFLPAASACAGLATVYRDEHFFAAALVVLGVYFFMRAMPGRLTRSWQAPAITVFALTLSVKGAMFSFYGADTYAYMSILFEGVFAAALAPALTSALTSARSINGIRPLAVEEAVCVLVLVAGVVAGTGDMQLWQVTVKGLISRIIVMVGALAGGAGLGAAAGALVGIIPGLSYTSLPLLVGAYSFSGLVSGLGRQLGKIGVAVGFLLGNIILAVYISDYNDLEGIIAETAAAVLIFMLLPANWIKSLTHSISPGIAPEEKEEAAAFVREAMQERIGYISALFRELSGVFTQVSAAAVQSAEERDLDALMKEINNKVCYGCGMYRTCWDRDYYRTYQSVMEMFALVEMYGRVTTEDMPGEIRKRCTRPRELAITVSCLYDSFSLNRFWINKLSESRSIIGRQLSGMAGVIESLSGELDFRCRDLRETDQVLRQRLKQMGYPVYDVRVSEKAAGKEIYIVRRACGGSLDCHYRMAPSISEIMGRACFASGCICEGLDKEQMCSFYLYQGLGYDVETGVASAGKGGSTVIGDSYGFAQLSDGRFAVFLSDGMGSGEDASVQSTATIAILKRLIECGMNVETALKTVNSILMLRLPEEIFSTVDMAVINLYSGQAEIVKIASPPSFLITGPRVSPIRGNSLPVGIISDIEVTTAVKNFSAGDLLVMVTDGVLDSYSGTQDKEEWITGVLQEAKGMEPQEIADLLLELAQTGAGENQVADDMTAVVIKLVKQK